MKRGTVEHPKVAKLCALLNLDRFEAVGILEIIWHFTAKYAPRGDIGRFDDKAIAAAVGWQRPTGRPGVSPECRLSEALVQAGWLESHHTHRLIVHDWHEHADQTVKRFLASRNLAFASTELAKTSLPLPVPVPEPIPVALPVRAINSPPSATVGEFAHRMYSLHPKKKNMVLVPPALWSEVKSVSDPEATLREIEECHAAWCASQEWNRDGGRYVVQLAEWLADKGYTKWPPGHSRNRPSKPQGLGEYRLPTMPTESENAPDHRKH